MMVKPKTEELNSLKYKIMKKFLLLLTALLLVNFTTAQEVCSKYYPLEEGTSFQLTSYDGKGKVTAIVDYKIVMSTGSGNGQKATIQTEIKDKDGTKMATSEYDIICENDRVSIDFKSLMGPDVFSQFPDMDMEVTGTALEIPNNLYAGLGLPDADMQAAIDMGMMKMNMTVYMTNRKVEGEESVTTPAGTFDCYVISYDHEFKMGMKQQGTAKQWLAEGVGLVQQIDYNKKGKEMSRSVLTAFSN